MLCLGLSGGLSKIYENSLDLPNTFMHDGAAVLVRDGRVIAAVEEERLNRIKHSNKLPRRSIQYCLEYAGVQLSDIDCSRIMQPRHFAMLCSSACSFLSRTCQYR